MSHTPKLLAVLLLFATATADEQSVDRSPRGLALSRDGRWAVTANATADSVSLVDLEEGSVSAEVEVGRRPFGIALTGSRAVVTNQLSGSISVVELRPPWLRVAATIPVGDEPRGVALSSDGSRAYVALAGDDRVALVDLASRSVIASATVGAEPWHVAITQDGRRLAVGNARSMDVTVLDATTLAKLHSVRLLGHNVREIAISEKWAYVPNITERGNSTTRNHIDNGWVIANRLNRVPLDEAGPREAIALDPRGEAVGDIESVALSGETIALAAGGTHELVLLRQPLPFVAYGGPADHIDPKVLAQSFRRVPLGGRPTSITFTPDGKLVVVANYISNCLQLVNVTDGKLVRTISLGGGAPSLARRGEALFHDAQRSFHQWYSCHSCHTEGHTNGALFDTFNDGREGNPKKTLSLRGVTRTAPYTWHGWQADLRASLENSLTKTMQGPKPSAEELDALVAWLATNDFRPGRAPGSSEAASRGAELFKKRGCTKCHEPPLYTTPEVHVVGLESEDDAYKGFNPPSLRNVRGRAPYLHDGRARTLTDVLAKHHPNDTTLSRAEIEDLVAFLESL